MKYPVVEIRKKAGAQEGSALTGANTEVLIDGEVIRGARKVTFEVEAAGIAKVTIELYANFAMTQEIGQLEQTIVTLEHK